MKQTSKGGRKCSATPTLRRLLPFVVVVAAVACVRGDPKATCSTAASGGDDSILAWDEPAAGVAIRGKMSFTREKDSLSFVKCPEGYPADRLALMSARGEICGYLMGQRDGSRRSIYVHQVGSGGPRPSLIGRFLLDAQVECPPDAIPCRVREPKGTRVFRMGTAGADSLLNDAIFLRETDTLVEFSAEGNVRVDTLAPGRFRVRLSGENDGEYAVRIVKDYFRSRNMPHYRPIDRRRAPHAPTGWMAWNIYFDQATAKDNLDEARAGAKYLKRFGLEYWSIESWQGNSDVLPVAQFHNLDLSCNEKQFPQGMKAVADEIRSIGFKPGLWIVPWGTGDKAFYEAHRSWFVHEPNGRPMSAWPGRYILDVTNDEALEHVRKMIRTYAEDWGYEFFKIDGMGAGFGWPSLKMMRPEIKRSLAQPNLKDPIYRWTHMFREAMGDRYFLACGAALTSPGLEDCDATRIGGDIVHPNKPVQWGNMLMQASATMRRYYSHNIVAWNDPDTLMVDPNALSMEDARITTTVVGLPGQVMFSGDKITQLPLERIRLIQTDLPVVDTRPMDLYPINDLRPLWNLAVKTPYQSWNVVAIFNWGEKAQTISATFQELGLDPEERYALYETWEEKWLGYAKGSFAVAVPPHAVRLLTVHPAQARPILISSDRHITRGAQDVESVALEGERALSFRTRLVSDHPVTLRFLLPDGWRYAGDDADCRLEADGRILAVRLFSSRSETVSRTIPVVR